MIYKTKREKYNAIIQEVIELRDNKRPVLIGTTSVEISELLSKMLNRSNVNHNVLNAKLHKKEADIVAEAGKPGIVTIATNMAGRGTDIKLSQDVIDSGGLAIIGTERHDSRRVDRQLRGRSGRQGDPGSSQFFVSFEDNLMRLFGSDRVTKVMDRMGLQEGENIQHSMVTKTIERAQKKVEENNFGIRKRLLEYDDVMNSQRTIIYTLRKNALKGEKLKIDISNMLFDTIQEIVTINKNSNRTCVHAAATATWRLYLAVHEQKDPLLIYKFEAYELFKNMIVELNKELLSFLFKGSLPNNENNIKEAAQPSKNRNYRTTKDEALNTDEMAQKARQVGASASQSSQKVETVVHDMPKIGRNEIVEIKNTNSGEVKKLKFKNVPQT